MVCPFQSQSNFEKEIDVLKWNVTLVVIPHYDYTLVQNIAFSIFETQKENSVADFQQYESYQCRI
jgi:hypothetical protein